MSNAQFAIGWRQSRIFTSNFSAQWYFDILANVVLPFSQQFPDSPFFFTRYVVPRGGPDDGDTDINQLPANFLQNTSEGNIHRSIRLRFCAAGAEEASLEQLIRANAAYWYHDFRHYDVLGEFGGPRFCPSSDISFRMRRTQLLGSLLHTNSLFVLHSMQQNGGNWAFERNTHQENRPFDATFISVLHLLNQPSGKNDGKKLPLCILPNPLNQNLAFFI